MPLRLIKLFSLIIVVSVLYNGKLIHTGWRNPLNVLRDSHEIVCRMVRIKCIYCTLNCTQRIPFHFISIAHWAKAKVAATAAVEISNVFKNAIKYHGKETQPFEWPTIIASMNREKSSNQIHVFFFFFSHLKIDSCLSVSLSITVQCALYNCVATTILSIPIFVFSNEMIRRNVHFEWRQQQQQQITKNSTATNFRISNSI